MPDKSSEVTELEKKWIAEARKVCLGKRIVEVGYMHPDDSTQMGIFRRPVVLVLEDGTQLIPMSDDEGNDGGSIHTSHAEVQIIPCL